MRTDRIEILTRAARGLGAGAAGRDSESGATVPLSGVSGFGDDPTARDEVAELRSAGGGRLSDIQVKPKVSSDFSTGVALTRGGCRTAITSSASASFACRSARPAFLAPTLVLISSSLNLHPFPPRSTVVTATITALNIHPLKSGTIHHLPSAVVGPHGLVNDRLFMTIDHTGRLVSQRDPDKVRLALIHADLTDTQLTLTAPGMQPLVLPRSDPSRTRLVAALHTYTAAVLDCGAAASAWLTSFLGEHKGHALRLVQFDESSHRRLNPAWVAKDTHGTALADGYPVLVASEQSLADLNQRIANAGHDPISMDRMRPNIVLGNLPRAWDEDLIVSLQANGVQLAGVKPCDRCATTTVDQARGERGSNPGEPLSTLGTFRRGRDLLGRFPDLPKEAHPNVFFGMNMVVVAGQGGTLAVGDTVELELRDVRRTFDTGN